MAVSDPPLTLARKGFTEDSLPGQPLPRSFFSQTPVECARGLIGAFLVWEGQAYPIVETEAYDAVDDPACHTFRRPSAREFVRHNPAGTAYVYLNYGVHWLVNVLIKGGEREGFVLFRAVELPGNRGAGPGRLTKALGITGKDHGRDLCAEEAFGFRQICRPAPPIQTSPRIGISLGKELPWRFFWFEHPAVSGSKQKSIK